MKKNSIIIKDNCYFRILAIKDKKVLAIDCVKRTINSFFETVDINTFNNSSFKNSEEDYELINKML